MSDQDSGPKPGHFLPGGAGDVSTGPESSTTSGQLSRLPHLTKPESVAPGQRTSKTAIAGLAVLTLVLLTGGVVGAVKLIGSFGELADSSQSAPSAPPQTPVSEPSPTVTVTAPEPDYGRIVMKNRIYTTGKLAPSRCKEPGSRPTSKQNVQKFYQAMLPCLTESWAPAVRKAGFEYRPPKLVVYEGVAEDSCLNYSTGPFYCSADEAIFLPWREDVTNYRKYPIGTRVDMADTLAHEFGHHVQFLTGILDASHARESGSGSKVAELQESRRLELQASCLAAAYLGANKSFSLTGELLDEWNFQAAHSGDEYSPDNVRDHGSRKSHRAWLRPAFTSANPGLCNTFTAPAAKVS